MSKYLLKIKPLDSFFFGQEDKYRKRIDSTKKGGLATVADYFQRSAYFPQQTTVLGMLRYYLLLMNNQIPIKNKDLAKELIGERSFDSNQNGQEFGKIENISPVFIVDEIQEKFLFPSPSICFSKMGNLNI